MHGAQSGVAARHLPKSVDPRVFLDGGVISGNCVSASDKNTSFHHANNPLIKLLLAGHGERWNFVGTVITNQPIRLAEKEKSSRDAASMVMGLNASGAIVTKELHHFRHTGHAMGGEGAGNRGGGGELPVTGLRPRGGE